LDAGCEIGNHTWTHTDMTTLNPNQINNEIEQCRAKLQQITGLKSFLVRPPYLATNDMVKNTVNVPMITCSRDTQDWNNASTDQIANTLRNAQDGDILVIGGQFSGNGVKFTVDTTYIQYIDGGLTFSNKMPGAEEEPEKISPHR